MTLHEVVWVFDAWDPSPDYPGQVGHIHCCGHLVVMRAGAIACDTCHSVVEQHAGAWRILRIKGRPYREGERKEGL
jgi:hypothetical protein